MSTSQGFGSRIKKNLEGGRDFRLPRLPANPGWLPDKFKIQILNSNYIRTDYLHSKLHLFAAASSTCNLKKTEAGPCHRDMTAVLYILLEDMVYVWCLPV